MSCCVTTCNDCGHEAHNVFTSYCIKCGSTNIDREHEPDIYDNDDDDSEQAELERDYYD